MRPDGQERYGQVRDWMTRAPATVDDACPIGVALARMRSAEIRHLLVFDGDRLVGIVSSRDLGRLAGALGRDPLASEPVRRIMTENPITVAPEMPVTRAARLLLESRIGALPVRDDDAIVGIFTLSDALEALLSMVEGPGA
ncbi:MAG: CBS domain-containing protein [Candidatus Rokubacteria bacterium]|nr:CBS domain-containing protein [Candidatus Rokubacteria bacterium]